MKNLLAWAALSILTLTTGFSIYWFGVRPSMARSMCAKQSTSSYQQAVDALAKDRDEKVLKATGQTWETMFQCRESTPITLSLLASKDPYKDAPESQKHCVGVLLGVAGIFGESKAGSWPIDTANTIDRQMNVALHSLEKTKKALLTKNM